MKRIIIGITSGIVLVALVLGVLPVSASESEVDFVDTGSRISGSSHNANALSSPATRCEYDPLTAPTGELYTFTISATDADNDSLIYSASNLPPGATFDPQTRTFSWTPGYDQAGVYPDVHFEVSDGELTDSEDITITVINVERPPVLDYIGDKLANEEELVQFTIEANDPDNDPLTYAAYNLPSGATFDPKSKVFNWIPGSGQRGRYSGVRFEASDGKLTDSEDITITVTSPQEAACSVGSLKIRPGKASTGKNVNISVQVTNSGHIAGSYEVTLKINGTIEDNKILYLSAGVVEEVTFVTVEDIPGVYMVDVNGLTGKFEVRSENKGRGQKPRSRNIMNVAIGWIRTLLNEGGDA